MKLISLTFVPALVSRVIFEEECGDVVVCWDLFGLFVCMGFSG